MTFFVECSFVGFGIKLYGTISSNPGLAGDLQNPVKPLQAVFDNYSDLKVHQGNQALNQSTICPCF